jgi:hypothetical protein
MASTTSLVFTPVTPVIGESVLCEVKSASGQPLDPTVVETVQINGVPGARTYLQFVIPGPQTVLFQSIGSKGPEFGSAVVIVKDVPPTLPPLVTNGHTIQRPNLYLWPSIGLPILQMSRQPINPHVVSLLVGIDSPSATSTTETTTPATLVPSAPTLHPVSEAGSQVHTSASASSGLPTLTLPPVGKETYTWYFGDGTSLNTMARKVEHDYTDAIDPLVEHQSFDISVTTTDGIRRVARTITFANAYAMLKRTQNRLHPGADSNGFATRTRDAFVASFSITNPELQDMKLLRRRFVPLPPDGNAVLKPAPVENITAIIVPAKKTSTFSVMAGFNQVQQDSLGFSVYYSGLGPDGIEVRVNVHFDLEPSQRPIPKVILWNDKSKLLLAAIQETLIKNKLSGATAAQLKSLNPSIQNSPEDFAQLNSELHMIKTGTLIPGALKPPNSVLPSTLHDIPGTHLPNTALLPPGTVKFSPDPGASPDDPADAPPALHGQCFPDNLPDVIPPNLACQATTEPNTQNTPARFRNAWKGHTVLAPGAVGPVGKLLTQVDHPQKYSHCGIMTNNFEQITHCTMSMDRLQAYPKLPLNGFRTDIIKYGWPGTITQTVAGCVCGSSIPDPEHPAGQTGIPYEFKDFNAFPEGAEWTTNGVSSWILIPQLVVKPDPMLEDDSLRQRLHAVADDAYAHMGKHHYRFYCYTDPTITSDPTKAAPGAPGSQWPGGTAPSCCSSFIWEMMKRNTFHLAGAKPIVQPSDLSADQVKNGAKVGPTTQDGLYLYSAKERLNAANYLYQAMLKLVDDAVESAATIGGIEFNGLASTAVNMLTQMRSKVANEFVNFFARDAGTMGDEDQSWQNTVDANACSPDNIMLWNGPAAPTPGPYGYVEPCVFTEERFDVVTISRWALVHATGTLSGTVTFNNLPAVRAMVSVGGNMVATTDPAGHYSIPNVPWGTYWASATQVQADGQLNAAKVALDMESASQTLEIVLVPPPGTFRKIVIDGYTNIHYDYHLGPFPDIRDQKFPFHQEVVLTGLTPAQSIVTTPISFTLGQATAILTVTTWWQPDKAVKVWVDFQLHGDFGGPKDPFVIPPGGVVSFDGNQVSANADNDQAWSIFTITNAQADA